MVLVCGDLFFYQIDYMLTYLQIFYKPGSCIENLMNSERAHSIAQLVVFLFSAIQSLPYWMAQVVGTENVPASNTIPFKVIAGGLIGLGVFYLFAFFLRNFGRWFGAQASVKAIRTGLGIALIPWTVLFALFFLALGAFGPKGVFQQFPLFFMGFIYGFTIVMIAMSKVFKVGALKSFLILLFTFFVTLWPMNQIFKMVLSN